MKSSIKNMTTGKFIFGAQEASHKWRMFLGSATLIFKVTMVVALIFTGFFIYKIPKYDLRVTGYYFKAKATIKISKNEKTTITVVDSKGARKDVPVRFVLTNLTVIQTKKNVVDGFIWSLIYSLITPIVLSAWFWWQGKRNSANKTKRGMEKVKAYVLARLVRKYNDRILRRNAWGILEILRRIKCKICKEEFKPITYRPYVIADNIEYPAYGEHQHTIVVGGTGVGKTVWLLSELDQINARMESDGEIAIVYDKMRSFTPKFYKEGRDVILNPYDERSKNWSVFAEVREGREATDLELIAAALMSVGRGDKDFFWKESARNLFIEICKKLIKIGEANNGTLAKWILNAKMSSLKEFLKDTNAARLFDREDGFADIRSTLISYTKFLTILNPNANKEDTFSVRNFITGVFNDDVSGRFLFLTSRSDVHETLQPLLTCQIDIAINTLLSMKQQKSRNVWFILDELPSINMIPTLDSGLAQSRQFGGSFILLMQSPEQLKHIYGEKCANVISGNCKTRLVFALQDSANSKWASETLGKKEIDEMKEGITVGAHEMRDGISRSRNIRIEEVVMPTEVEMLPNLNFYLRVGHHFPIAKVEIKPIDREDVAEGFTQKIFIPINVSEPTDPVEGLMETVALNREDEEMQEKKVRKNRFKKEE